MGVTPIVPGQGLDELFGCRRADIRTAPAVFLPKLQLGGLPIETRMHKESLQPQDGARVIGTFSSGEIAAVEHSYGKGRAIYLGTNPFLSYCVNADPNLITWMHTLHGDIPRHAYTDVPDIVARVLISGDSKLVFLLNTLAQTTTVQLTVPFEGTDMPAIRELVTGTSGPVRMDGKNLCIDEELEAYGTRVYVVGE